MMTQVFTGPPIITNPLTDQVIRFNERITLNCKASGDGTVSYQWQEFSNGLWMDISNGSLMDISNSTTPEYTTDRLTESSQFRCIVSNEAGEVTSVAMILVLGNCIEYNISFIAYISVDDFTILKPCATHT